MKEFVISLKQYPTVGPFVLIISFQKETSLTYLGKHILLASADSGAS
jgi:hypothetical protein